MTRSITLVSAVALLAGCGVGQGSIVSPAGSTAGTSAAAGGCADRAGQAFCDGNQAIVCDDLGGLASSETCDTATQRCEAGACVGCEPVWTVPGAGTLDGGVQLDLDTAELPFEEQRLAMRELRLLSAPGTQIDLTGEAVALYSEDGAPLTFPLVTEQEETLLLAHGHTRGSSTLTVTPAGSCQTAPAALALQVDTRRPLTGRSLITYPHFEWVDAFNADDSLQTAFDPSHYSDRVGATADVYVVPDRSRAEWAAEPSLTDVADGPVTVTVGGDLTTNISNVWLSDLSSGPDLTTAYDVVYDFGQDGRLDPGDLVDGLEGAGFESVIPLSAPGPHTPLRAEYSESYWNTHYVYWPEEAGSLDPLPLVVISHGNGHDYTWYDYLGEHLASWGYVVISHRNDTEPGPVSASRTTRSNTEVFLRDLSSIADGALDGRVDRSSIVWIGHSRGGEGVVLAYDDLLEGDASEDQYGWEDIRIVSSIAPTLFEDPYEADPHEVTYHLLAGSSDGDVTGGPESPVTQYFRIFQNGRGDGLVTYVQGAAHNDFNCCGFDDGVWTSGPGRQISREAAQQLTKAYYLALLEYELRGRHVLGEYLWRMPALFQPMGVREFMSNQWMPAWTDKRIVVDDFQEQPDPLVSSWGGAVRSSVSNLVEGILDDGNGQLAWDGDAFNGMTWAQADDPARAERGIVFDWSYDSPASLGFDLPPEARDLADGGFVSFRVCQGTRHPNTTALDDLLSFSVVLVDSSGAESAIDFGVYGRVPEPFARTGGGSGTGWSNEFSTVRVPVLAFTTERPELDLTSLTTLRFDFGADHGSPIGRVGLDDVEILLP